ncbi:MAG: hypothetical protein II984_11130, partial [Clostridia bacterium]|nr:hypothetical protein [Clostridia bacterium]
MRKFNKFIALLLCFLTILSCFSLIACNGTTSSDTESDVVNTDTSTDTSIDTDTDDEKPDKEPEKPLTIDQLNKRDEVLEILDNNYLSRNEIVYENINGKDVTIYTSFRAKNEVQNNPNFAQIQMVYQAIQYKKKYPDKNVDICLSSYRISGSLSACLDEDSEEYGNLKNLYDKDYDLETGYYRLTYLLCEAARYGINVTV